MTASATARCERPDAHVATYAILLQCTGVALWFDPRGPLKLEQVAELHVELVLGSLQASRGADRRGDRERLAAARSRRSGSRDERAGSSRPPCPSRATIAVVAPASPPQTRSGIEQATAYFEARGHRVVFGPNHRKVHGYLAGTDEERAADLQWALSEPGIDMVHTLCGGYGTARLHDRIDWDAAGRAAHRLRLQRHHRPPPRARRARRLGLVLRAELPALHAAEGRVGADQGDGGLVPPRLRARAARPRVRGPARTPTCSRWARAWPRRRWSAAT